jgi:cytochrome c oxidase accessory protein FixG
MHRDAQPTNLETFSLKLLKHSIWLLLAWWMGGVWVLYFADAPTLVVELATFRAEPIAYISIFVLTFTTYTFAGLMREQVCLYMCPWPRIQAALTDEHALNVTYRYDRGEPRMSLKKATHARSNGEPAGDCIDCQQCVAVCPTGVDIRHGPELGCIQCGLCIDACDEVMLKINRPTRLIAYDTDVNIKRRQAYQAKQRHRNVIGKCKSVSSWNEFYKEERQGKQGLPSKRERKLIGAQEFPSQVQVCLGGRYLSPCPPKGMTTQVSPRGRLPFAP